MTEQQQDKWAQIIDKLTDPIENMINKIFSARFLMAVIVTYFGCRLTWAVCDAFVETNRELVVFVVGQFFMLWMMIAKDYFNRQDRQRKEA